MDEEERRKRRRRGRPPQSQWLEPSEALKEMIPTR